jgi:hypothetical protein
MEIKRIFGNREVGLSSEVLSVDEQRVLDVFTRSGTMSAAEAFASLLPQKGQFYTDQPVMLPSKVIEVIQGFQVRGIVAESEIIPAVIGEPYLELTKKGKQVAVRVKSHPLRMKQKVNVTW